MNVVLYTRGEQPTRIALIFSVLAQAEELKGKDGQPALNLLVPKDDAVLTGAVDLNNLFELRHTVLHESHPDVSTEKASEYYEEARVISEDHFQHLTAYSKLEAQSIPIPAEVPRPSTSTPPASDSTPLPSSPTPAGTTSTISENLTKSAPESAPSTSSGATASPAATPKSSEDETVPAPETSSVVPAEEAVKS